MLLEVGAPQILTSACLFQKATLFGAISARLLSLIDNPSCNTLRCLGFARSAAGHAGLYVKLPECLLVACLLLPSFEVEAQEHGRVKWKRPTQAEADHMASESAITDIILRKGDIVVTDRGFFMFRGFLADGRTGDFIPVPNPMSNARK